MDPALIETSHIIHQEFSGGGNMKYYNIQVTSESVFLPIHSINLLAKQIKYLSQSKVSHFSGARYNHLVLCGKSQGEC